MRPQQLAFDFTPRETRFATDRIMEACRQHVRATYDSLVTSPYARRVSFSNIEMLPDGTFGMTVTIARPIGLITVRVSA